MKQGVGVNILRRRALKFGVRASGLAVPTVLGLSRMTPAYAQESSELAPPSSLGRVTYVSLNIREAPTTQSTLVRRHLRDDVIPLFGQIVGFGRGF